MKEYPALDGILSRTTELVRPLSAVMIIVCTAVVIWSTARLVMSSGSPLEVPKWKSVQERYEAVGAEARTMKQEEFLQLQEEKTVEAKFGGKIEKLIAKHGLAGTDKIVILKNLKDLEPDQRSLFVSGMSSFLTGAEKFNKSMQKTEGASGIDIPDAAVRYTQLFKNAVKQAETAKDKMADERAARARTLSNSIGLLMFFLILPLLIQISENTRRVA